MTTTASGSRVYFEAIVAAAAQHQMWDNRDTHQALDNTLRFAQELAEERMEATGNPSDHTRFIGPTIINILGALRAELAKPQHDAQAVCLDIFDATPDIQAMFLAWEQA